MEKILYWIGTNFTHYCIAKSLRGKIPNKSYAIFDVTNKPEKFFETENIVNFEKKWFFHNNIFDTKKMPDLEYLSRFEKVHNIKLSKIVFFRIKYIAWIYRNKFIPKSSQFRWIKL